MKNLKNNKAITLIALVITIIVLIILAGVSISLLLDENGIITKSRDAKSTTIVADVKEKITLAVASAYAEGEGTITYTNLNNEISNTFRDGNYTITPASDANEWTITRPTTEGDVTVKVTKNGKTESSENTEPTQPGGGELTPTQVPISSITFTQDSVNLQRGNTTTITATVLPNNTTETLVWNSSDSNIASISVNGNVATITANAAGTATITASSPTNSNIKATCTVTVPSSTITFYIDLSVYGGSKQTYTCESGTTWEEFCSAQQNFSTDGDYVWMGMPGGYVYYKGGGKVSKGSTINNNTTYDLNDN